MKNNNNIVNNDGTLLGISFIPKVSFQFLLTSLLVYNGKDYLVSQTQRKFINHFFSVDHQGNDNNLFEERVNYIARCKYLRVFIIIVFFL